MRIGRDRRSIARHIMWFLVLAALAYAILRIGTVSAIAVTNPQVALQIAPDNAAALAAASVDRLQPLSPQDVKEAASLALRSYSREPVSVIAVRQLGFAEEASGRATRARAILRQSELLSHRDFPGQLWLIEDAVVRGDVKEALRHYDVALRASKLASAILFDPLTKATAEPSLIQPLADTLLKGPIWGNFFLLQAASTSTEPRNVVRLMMILLSHDYAVAPIAVQSVAGRLIQAKDYDAAWALFSALRPGAQRAGLRSPNFEEVEQDGLPFAWSFDVSGSAVGVLRDDEQGKRLAFQAPVGTGGVVLRQMLLLPPGTYALSSEVVENNAGGENAPMWQLTCADGSGGLGALSLPVVTEGSQQVRKVITVGSCRAQSLELVLKATDHPEGVVGAIKNVTIKRIASGARHD